MDYDDFVLQIEADGDGLRSHVLVSEAGETSETLEPPPGEMLAGTPDVSGQALYRAVFRDSVGGAFDRSRGSAEARGRGLRLKLRFDLSRPGGARAADWPWETLAEDPKRPFSLDPATPVVRYLEVRRSIRPVRLVPPLRVLAVAADPRGCSPLPIDLEAERSRLTAMSDGRIIDFQFPDRATINSVEAKLRSTPPHVFHFMGHGLFDPKDHRGYLYFETKHGGKDPVGGDCLSRVLTATGSPTLVVLNACESARTDSEADNSGGDPFSGVATELVQGGVPAVVAMRTPVGNSQAIAFSQAFYQALAQKHPIDAAVTAGRSAMHAADRTSDGWSVPVLFLRVADGRLFEGEPVHKQPENSHESASDSAASASKINHLHHFTTEIVAVGEKVIVNSNKS